MEMSNIISELEQYEEELSLYEAIIDKLGADEEFRILRIEILLEKGLTLPIVGRYEEAAHTFTEVLMLANEVAEESFIAKALDGLARTFVRLGRPKHGVALYNQLLGRFSGNAALEHLLKEAALDRDKAMSGNL